MSDVFISYAEEDLPVAREIADGIEAAGYTTWYYDRDSLAGIRHFDQTSRQIEQSRAVLLLISPRSINAHQVDSEVTYTHEMGGVFVPILCELSHEEFRELKPTWVRCLMAATAIRIPAEGVRAILPRIVGGLEALGIEPKRREKLLEAADASAEQASDHGEPSVVALRQHGEPGEDGAVSADVLSAMPSRYRLEARLGATDLSLLYRVYDREESVERMLKVTDLRRVLQGPVQLLTQIEHPRIAHTHASWRHGDFHCEVTDLIRGWSLHALLAANPHGIGLGWVEAWAEELLDIIAYLHSLSPPVIHRDVKPANIIITASGRYVTLVDMSLAVHPQPGDASGTIISSRYSALEQYHGQCFQASDLYSWGATVCALVTGQPPPDATLRAAGRDVPMTEQLSTSLVGEFALTALSLERAARGEATTLLRELRQAKEQTRLLPPMKVWLAGRFPPLPEPTQKGPRLSCVACGFDQNREDWSFCAKCGFSLWAAPRP